MARSFWQKWWGWGGARGQGVDQLTAMYAQTGGQLAGGETAEQAKITHKQCPLSSHSNPNLLPSTLQSPPPRPRSLPLAPPRPSTHGELVQVRDPPLRPQALGDDGAQPGVAEGQPAALRHAVGLVLELVGPQLVEVLWGWLVVWQCGGLMCWWFGLVWLAWSGDHCICAHSVGRTRTCRCAAVLLNPRPKRTPPSASPTRPP